MNDRPDHPTAVAWPAPGTPEARAALATRFPALVGLLSKERQHLERLVFKQTELLLLVEAEQHRFLARSSDEVGDMERDLGTIEAARAMLVADIAALLGVPDEKLTLSALIREAPAPEASALTTLRDELLDLAEECKGLGERGVKAAATRLQRISAAVKQLESGALASATGYDRWGAGESAGSTAPTRIDESA